MENETNKINNLEQKLIRVDRARFERLRGREGTFNEVASRAVKSFNKDEADHQFALKRISVAQWTIFAVSILLAFSLWAVYLLQLSDKHHIMQGYISSLFSILTLTMGFIAGSSIDKK